MIPSMSSFMSYLTISIIAIVNMIVSFKGVFVDSPTFANFLTLLVIPGFAKYRSDY